MDELIEKIRVATIADANDEARAAGADACRTLLIALEAKAGEPLAPPPMPAPAPSEFAIVQVAAPSSTTTPQATAQAIVSALRGMSPDQLLDVAIARLRAALPQGTTVPATQPLKFHLIPINRAVGS